MVTAPGRPLGFPVMPPPFGAPGFPPPLASPATSAVWSGATPWGIHDGFEAGTSLGLPPMQAALQILFDQALLALLISYFERQGGDGRAGAQNQRRGSLGAARPWRQSRRTSWQPAGGGPSSPGGGGGPVAAADTRAPASLDALPQGERSVGRFLRAALAQNGNEYEYGAGRNLNDADPHEFDCSGLVYWSMHQAGIDPNAVGSWSGAQAQGSRRISVEDALRTPGALLFKQGHVAISLGDGRTIEAMSERHGVKIGNAQGRGWSHGGLVPGMDYGGSIGVVG